MSIDYSIFCHKHKLDLWIGQRNYIYTGEPHTMKVLEMFLYSHQGCPLSFDHDQAHEEGYTKIYCEKDGSLDCMYWTLKGDSIDFKVSKEDVENFLLNPENYITKLK